MTKLAVGFAEAEEMTDISQWTWRRLVNLGTVKAARVGDRIVIPIKELQKIVKAGAAHGTGEKGKGVRARARHHAQLQQQGEA
jgi:hypothetical protein